MQKAKWVKLNKEISDVLCKEIEKEPFMKYYSDYFDELEERLTTIIEKKHWPQNPAKEWMGNLVSWNWNYLQYKEMIIERHGFTMDDVEQLVPRIVLEKDEEDFKSGYRHSVACEKPPERICLPDYPIMHIRKTESGIWGYDEFTQANAYFMQGGKEQKMLLEWFCASSLVEMVMRKEAKDIRIKPFHQGKLYASVERSLDFLVTTSGCGCEYEDHSREAVAGLYLLGKLEGMETPEIKASVKRLPGLKKLFEMELARFHAGFINADAYMMGYW